MTARGATVRAVAAPLETLLPPVPARRLLEQLDLAGALVREPIEVRGGHALVPERPGLGPDRDDAALRKFETAT